METRQSLVVEQNQTQTTDEQSSQVEDVNETAKVTTSETTSDKKKSLKDQMKDKAKKLKKFIGGKSSSSSGKKQKEEKEVRILIKNKSWEDNFVFEYLHFGAHLRIYIIFPISTISAKWASSIFSDLKLGPLAVL